MLRCSTHYVPALHSDSGYRYYYYSYLIDKKNWVNNFWAHTVIKRYSWYLNPDNEPSKFIFSKHYFVVSLAFSFHFAISLSSAPHIHLLLVFSAFFLFLLLPKSHLAPLLIFASFLCFCFSFLIFVLSCLVFVSPSVTVHVFFSFNWLRLYIFLSILYVLKSLFL